ncbi:NAD(P)-dependent oxidoreductase [Martelella mediterranea]|uniref:2-(Hydroxymethyl)glutarate dehydrogenase n=1 Tax=Martelella mediterranea DSM 17316 TaxID=1122214 RepID=A0A1U9Z8E4_9HYPH|nr:NAD(P)-dependent oxidoreductase [Martelella mediterranea]AQZ53900.1 2-(hydroxymethyl)glutarate dehydrogenase [Martelella mediterranea DSM 17316]
MTAPLIGFAGLGVMGEPICRNMLQKSGAEVRVFDLADAPVDRLVALGAKKAESVAALAAEVDILFLSLPGGPQVESVILGKDGVLEHGRKGLTVVDMSTAPVSLTRTIDNKLAERGIDFADAPVARTRQAAEDGTLSIMVGGSDAVFDRIRPLLAHAATDITHCGPVGCGQVVKILNNMVLFETVVALSEALALGKAAGVDPDLLFDTMSKGSADSFALRNHGMKAMLKDSYPKGAFPTDYALKDVSYALDLAAFTGFRAHGAELAQARMEKARDAGFAQEYFPVLSRLMDKV